LKSAGGTVTAVHLAVNARVPGAGDEVFLEAGENDKKGCSILRLLDAKIAMETRLAS